jgi:hypothetical protein
MITVVIVVIVVIMTIMIIIICVLAGVDVGAIVAQDVLAVMQVRPLVPVAVAAAALRRLLSLRQRVEVQLAADHPRHRVAEEPAAVVIMACVLVIDHHPRACFDQLVVSRMRRVYSNRLLEK